MEVTGFCISSDLKEEVEVHRVSIRWLEIWLEVDLMKVEFER